jgi:hypothetical protein
MTPTYRSNLPGEPARLASDATKRGTYLSCTVIAGPSIEVAKIFQD